MPSSAVLALALGLSLPPLGLGEPPHLTSLQHEAIGLFIRAELLLGSGRRIEALDASRKVLDLHRRMYPPAEHPGGHPDLVSDLLRHGELLSSQGFPRCAEPYLLEALAMARQLHPDGAAEVVALLHELGDWYQTQGDLARAEPFFRDGAEMGRKLFPRGSPLTAELLNQYAVVLGGLGKRPEAERRYRESLAQWERIADGAPLPELALVLNNLATHLEHEADPAERDRLLARSVALCEKLYPEGHPVFGNALNRLGLSCFNQGRLDDAEGHYRRALAMREKLHADGPHPDLATSLGNLGVLLEKRGDFDAADRLQRRALEMRRTLYPLGHFDVALSLDNLAALREAEGKFREAEGLLDQAQQVRDRLTKKPSDADLASRADLLTRRGRSFLALGEYARAGAIFEQVLEINRALYPAGTHPKGHPALASSLHDLGAVHSYQGEFAKVARLQAEALAMRRALYPDGHPDLVSSLANVGSWNATAGDPDQAERLLRDALAMAAKVYPPAAWPAGHADQAFALAALGNATARQGKPEEAREHHAEALAAYRKLYPREGHPRGHPTIATQLFNLGTVAGSTAEAKGWYREALAACEALYPADTHPNGHPDLVLALHHLAHVLAAEGDPAGAEPLARRALGLYQALAERESRGMGFTPALNFLAAQPLALDGYLSLTRAWRDGPAAYPLVWRVKGQVGRLLEQRQGDLVASNDPRTRRLYLELEEVRHAVQGAFLSRSVAPAERDRLTERKEKLERQIAEALGDGQAGPAAAASVEELRQALPPDAALVDFLAYADFEYDRIAAGKDVRHSTWRYVAFVVTRDRAPVRIEVGPSEAVYQAWGRWGHAIQSGRATGEDERKAARAFAEAVRWPAVRRAIPAGVRTLFLSPGGDLSRVPFAALPGDRPGTVLLEDFALATVHSPTFLHRHLTRRSVPPRSGTALLVGAVDYAGRPPAVAGAAASRAPRGDAPRVTWEPLAGSKVELERLGELARAANVGRVVSRSGPHASTGQVLADLPDARFAHFATHGFFADARGRERLLAGADQFRRDGYERAAAGARNPLVLSGLVFAGANRTGGDEPPDRGILTAEAIVGKSLAGLELAVLSACDTGLGDGAGGEGVLGLQRAFHVAGCPSVVASLWKVEDDATAALMGLFYRNLWKEKQPPRDALRNAQLALYRNPALAKQLGGRRGIDFTEVDIPPPPKEPTPAAPASPRAPTRQWAAFSLSGVR